MARQIAANFVSNSDPGGGIVDIDGPESARRFLNALRELERNGFDARRPLPSPSLPLTRPPLCAWLRPGQQFCGYQRVTHWTPGKGEQWAVTVTLHGYDHSSSRLCGTITATNVPDAFDPVITFFEGEIVDNINISFYTSHSDWAALDETDIRHWSKFSEFLPLRKDVVTLGGRAPGLADCGAVFMRWKEKYFVSRGESRLTIAGFYYAALDRLTGAVQAVYYDPASSPDQRLRLEPRKATAGHAFPAHELA